MYWFLVVLLMLVSFVSDSFASDCPGRPHLGTPTLSGSYHLTDVCHAGYEALVDNDVRVPRWVAYELSGPHTLGCLPRKNDFHSDYQLPVGSARPADYVKSGYDKGHQAPAEDFAWNKNELHDSFSMANMAPQVPGLNRQQWERLEETVRAWALARGLLTIYVGPWVGDKNLRISRGRIVVPKGFWKVVVDNSTGQSLSFYMNNVPIPKGNLSPQLDPSGIALRGAGITLPLTQPPGTTIWPVNLPAFRKARAKACRVTK